MLNLAGHTVVGVGYDDSSNLVYIHDTWDYNNHTLTWGTQLFGHGTSVRQYCESSASDFTIPAAPGSLTATAVSSSRIDLSWADNSNNEEGFRIESCQGSGCTNFAQIATVGANVQTYSNTGLTAGVTYTYRVRAYNSGGSSTYSNTANATVLSGDLTRHRLFWAHASGQAAIWELDSSDNFVRSTSSWSLLGWTPKDYHLNSDGTGRLLWVDTSGQAAIWTLDTSDNYVSDHLYGPYPGWTAINYDAYPDGTGKAPLGRRGRKCTHLETRCCG